jgi:lysophospholipase L1-like esterase
MRRPHLLFFTAVLIAALVTLTTPAAAKDPFVYVALGDSYTSGPLVLPHDTSHVPQGCGQSQRNYPHLAALLLKVDELRDVSCGSAEIDEFYAPQEVPGPGTNRPQFKALGPDVDVVTVGIGGNDVGFVGAATDCIRLTPKVVPHARPSCSDRFTRNGGDDISRRITETLPKLGRALDDIHRLAPNAAVLVVSYPTALPDNRMSCYPYLPIRRDDMAYLVKKFKEMNRMLKTAAAQHNATYVDIYTPSIGHDACKPPALAWINGAVLVPPSYPAHPNDLSYLHSAPVVAKAIASRLG